MRISMLQKLARRAFYAASASLPTEGSVSKISPGSASTLAGLFFFPAALKRRQGLVPERIENFSRKVSRLQ